MRTQTVFKNRWMALLWAAGIIWAAYDFAGGLPAPDANSADANTSSNASDDPQIAQLSNAVSAIQQQ
ncbi:MAG: hypothetical protein KGJ05_09275 [Alphaproteobacteria bacterium]|nr:hypothetical protein [Alphaproteobacteria bacterium]